MFWPKLRPWGIMAGHDFHDGIEVAATQYAECPNGTKHSGAVKVAVEDFARQHDLQLSATYHDAPYNSWIIRKRDI